MAQTSQYAKAFTALLTFALIASGCTKKRDAALPDADAVQIFAISDFSTPTGSGFKPSTKSSSRVDLAGIQGSKATEEKGLVAIDAESSAIPKRLRFMFSNLEIAGQENQNFKIVFGVDSKYVTAYKLSNDLDSLTKFEKQLAVTPNEVELSIALQKAATTTAKKAISQKMAIAQKSRVMSLTNKESINVLVPLFKYEILAKGILDRTKNELRESTSTLTLRETEFSQATHIRINTVSDARKDVGSVEQRKELDQIFTVDSLDNKISTAGDLQSRFNFNMKFVADDAKVLTRLDSEDMKVYEMKSLSQLSADEQRLVSSNRAAGELIRCSEAGVSSQDQNCVLRLVAKVPVTYKNVRLNLADSNDNTNNTLELLKVTKSESQGLVEIGREVRADRARPTGIIDPLNTIKVSDLQGEFYFRRTFEDASNMLLIGKTGTSGDLSVVKFELEKDRLVVRNQKALVQYVGQGPKDREELVSVPVKYFKLEKVDADGVALQVPKLIDAQKEDAEYLEIDWTKNTIPTANSPLAFYKAGRCWAAQSSQSVTDMDMRLSDAGMLNFSLSGSYTLNPQCANKNEFGSPLSGMSAQFNYNIIERLSFKRRTQAQIDDVQFAPNIPMSAQSAMNFEIFTLTDQLTSPDVRRGREGSVLNRPMIHDFRNGKVVNYWVGGLKNSPQERRKIIEDAAREVIAEWNNAFHKAFKGTELDRSGDYLVLNTEVDTTAGHLGDLDRNYLWFMDMPTENGLLGVAQPAANPYSGTVIASNVIVYSGNSEQEVRGVLNQYKLQREYEKLLEDAKTQSLAEFQKQQAEEKAAAAQPTVTSNAAKDSSARVGQATSLLKNYDSYLKRLVLSARPNVIDRMSSKYTSSLKISRAGKQVKSAIKGRTRVEGPEVSSNNDFTRRVLQEALQGDFKNDPLMLEAIIAREMVRTEPGLSPQMKELLNKKAAMSEMSAEFDREAKKRGGCFMYTRNEYNDKYVVGDFDSLFKIEIKSTLLHELGHALGLVHNFKGSFDKENFAFEGEKTDRNYSSIMDYVASPEITYAGPGTYDVHALRAIYTGLIEVSDLAKAVAEKDGGKISQGEFHAKVINGKFLQLTDVKAILGFSNWADMQKGIVDKSKLLKHYYQCDDEGVGEEPACERYDVGASATEIVKNEIQDYHRSYASRYHSYDRVNFGIEQKITIIKDMVENFKKIRRFLDDYFKMAIYGSALSKDEAIDFKEASYLGYDFFHEIVRIPDTTKPFGNTPDEISERLMVVPYTLRMPIMKDGSQVMDEKGNPKFEEHDDLKILEARRVYDYFTAPGSDRIDTIGIGLDKQFALQFLLLANPSGGTDDSHTGWIGYNEFEQYFLGVKNATESTNMRTLLEIMSNQLKPGFVDQNHDLHVLDMPLSINKFLLDTSIGGIIDTNQYRYPGLDTYAEFFKVGSIRGGKTIKDRITAVRVGQDSKSEVAVRFYSPDSAVGSRVLIAQAARKNVLLENSEDLTKKIATVLKSDLNLRNKVAQAIKADEKLKDKSPKDIIAGSDELKKLAAEADQTAQDLVKSLTDLNQNEILASQAEITANPNMALDKQVALLRSMMMSSITTFSSLKGLLEQQPFEQVKAELEKTTEQKELNAKLATLDLLALGQDTLMALADDVQIKLKSGESIPGTVVMGLLMEEKTLKTSYESLMYSVEELARYTRLLSPEYSF